MDEVGVSAIETYTLYTYKDMYRINEIAVLLRESRIHRDWSSEFFVYFHLLYLFLFLCNLILSDLIKVDKLSIESICNQIKENVFLL